MPGKHRRLGDAVEDLSVQFLARLGNADDRIQRLAGMANLRLAGGADRGQRDDVDFGADPFGARDRLGGQDAQDRLQPIVAGMVQVVGLGRGEQDAVDAGAEDRGERRGAPGAKRAQHLGERVFQIAKRRGPGIQGGQRVDEYDLAVEAREVVAEERTHDMGLVGLVAPLHHRRERSRCDFRARRERQRREGECGRAREIAGHQEAARRQSRERIDVVARLPQIGGEQGGAGARDFFIGRGRRFEAHQMLGPGLRQRLARRRSARRDRLLRPLRIALVQQRKVEQPFAGIVDDVEVERRGAGTPGSRAFELDPQSKLRDAPRRLRPMAIEAVQGGQVLLVGEAGHGVVGLRLQTSAADAAFRGGGQNRHPRTRDQIVDQGGDEHGLAGAGKPRDAQPQGAAADIILQRTRDQAGFEDDV